MSGKYMAYVGSYSYTGKAKGITVFDVDVENGMFKERCEIEVDNSSYVIASSDGTNSIIAVSGVKILTKNCGKSITASQSVTE